MKNILKQFIEHINKPLPKKVCILFKDTEKCEVNWKRVIILIGILFLILFI